MKKALIIGKGRVGNALASQLLELGWNVNFITSQDLTYWTRIGEAISACDILCLTISTKDNGENALHYLQMGLSRNKPAVTAEKGSLANFFPELLPHLPKIGFNATVGGGSGILQLITKEGITVSRLHGVVNGTLNFLGSRLSSRRRVDKTIEAAIAKDLCESRIATLDEIVRAELEDLKLKCSIVFNLCDREQKVKAGDFSYSLLSGDRILRLFRSRNHKLVLHLERNGTHRFNDSFDVLFLKGNHYTLHCGFIEVEKLPFSGRKSPREEENALFVEYRDHFPDYAFVKGIGAGPIPTARIMVEDILRLTA